MLDKKGFNMKELIRQLIEMKAIFSIKYNGKDYIVTANIKPTTGGRYYRQVYSLYREWRLSFLMTKCS